MADRKHTPLILVTGSDRRQVYAAEKLASLDNTEVCAYLTDGEPKGARVIKTLGELPRRADMLLLPMPCSAGGGLEIPACGRLTCAELTPYLAKNAVVAGGKMPTALIEYFNSLGFTTATPRLRRWRRRPRRAANRWRGCVQAFARNIWQTRRKRSRAAKLTWLRSQKWTPTQRAPSL